MTINTARYKEGDLLHYIPRLKRWIFVILVTLRLCNVNIINKRNAFVAQAIFLYRGGNIILHKKCRFTVTIIVWCSIRRIIAGICIFAGSLLIQNVTHRKEVCIPRRNSRLSAHKGSEPFFGLFDDVGVFRKFAVRGRYFSRYRKKRTAQP